MTSSLKDLLAGRAPKQPDEMQKIIDFVQQRYDVTPVVTAGNSEFIIGVKSSALAGALRPQLAEIKAYCGTDKSLRIRIQ